ncbi:phytochrome A-like [Telopea speciosissima]|uniref:phytochrome A-like n=1 Tax=Telopea speciosissima TaxID=54955 RepID=UPI001CC4264F|nr:phytochrome A-like [Telopea speciosissima]
MSSSRPDQSTSSSSRSRHSARIIAQTTVDAKLHADFEELGSSFDYSTSVRITNKVSGDQQPSRSDRVTTAYLHHIQKGKLIQPFGCLLALDEKTLKVIAYSENASEMLTMVSHAVPSMGDYPVLGIGTDVRSIFTSPSASALHKALGFGEVSLLNPVLVHCKTSGKPLYAIVHRVTGSFIIDFEPVKPYEVPMTAAGALQSYKLAAKAIARLQSLPSGCMDRLCDTVVQEVYELTGYDRVMAYKFHEDDHGEVVSEITKPGLEPYLGLHYPATDIPQAARFLFMKCKVRMICDCRAKHVKVLQDEKLSFGLTLCGSTLRAPHSCHLQYMENMSSIASFVMAVVINEGNEESDESSAAGSLQPLKRKRLWGLVVCHNTTPRFIPFPLRYACEFLIQVFAIHVNKEIELENQILEKNILRTQTLLCDMLMRDAPLGIVSQSPNIMDLVKCDGAALLYKNKVWFLGLTPTESQIHEISTWLSNSHMDSTGLSTDSLYDAGFSGSLSLADVVCGMAAVRINSKDMLFWFRSPTAAEVQWGGAKHDPNDKDDSRRMHPRSSFKAFLEVVKTRSLPWKDYEMDAIHSLQLILRNAFNENESTADTNTSMIYSRLNNLKIEGMEELEAVTNEMVRLIETATVPILAVGFDGLINGWNIKIAELTGLPVDQAIGKHLLTLVEDSSINIVKRMLHLALQGKEEQNIQFEMKTHGSRADSGPVSLVVNACASRDLQENVVGVCFVAQDMTGQKAVMDKFTRIEGDYKAIVQNPNPLIPPIFGMDEFGWCSEWNPAMISLSGWDRGEVIDKMLLGEVFGTHKACCRLKNPEAFVNLGIVFNNAIMGLETEKISFSFFGRNGRYVDCLLSVSKKLDGEGRVTGVFCFLQLASQELQQALHVQRLSEQTALKKLKELTYIKQQIGNPLSGILFSQKMMEGSNLGEEQKQLLRTSVRCQHQLNKVLDDNDLGSIMDGYLDLEIVEFTLQEVLAASISQIMIKSNDKGVRIINDTVEEIMAEILYGDSLRLQQIFADFLSISMNFTPTGGQLAISACLTKDKLGECVHIACLELRITHTGGGIPEELLGQMFESYGETSEDGISLLVSRKLLRLMNGDIRYLREAGKSSFLLSAELASSQKSPSSNRSKRGIAL